MPAVNGQMRINATSTGAGLMRTNLSSLAGVMEWNDENVDTAGLMRVITTVISAAGLMRIKNNEN